MARARATYDIVADDKSAKGFASFNDRAKKAAKQAGNIGRSVGAIGGGGVLAGFGALVTQAAKTGDEIQKLSIKTGISTEFLSEMRHVSDLSGVSFNTLTKGIQNMVVKVGEAESGLKTSIEALEKIGLTVDDLAGKSPAEQFEIIGEALRNVEDAATRTEAAYVLFGGRGTEILQITQQGAEAINEMRMEADELGLSLNRIDADKLAAANDAVTRLSGSFRGLAQTTAIEFAGPFERLTSSLGENIIPALKTFTDVVGGVVDVVAGSAAAFDALTSGEFRRFFDTARFVGQDVLSGIGVDLAPGNGGARAPAGAGSEVSDRQLEVLERIANATERTGDAVANSESL